MEGNRKFNSSVREMKVALGEPHSRMKHYVAWVFDMEDGTRYAVASTECTKNSKDVISFSLAVSNNEKLDEIYNSIQSRLQRAKVILNDDFMPNSEIIYDAELPVLRDLLTMVPEDGDRVVFDCKKVNKDYTLYVIVYTETEAVARKLVFAGIANRNGEVMVLGYMLNRGRMEKELVEYNMEQCLSPFAFVYVTEYMTYYHLRGGLYIGR